MAEKWHGILLLNVLISVVPWVDCQNVPVIFSVAREDDMSEAELIVSYQHEYSNYGNYYSMLTGLVTLPNSSYIMQTLSGATLNGKSMNFNLHEGQPPSGTDRSNLYTTESNFFGSTTNCRTTIAKSVTHDTISTSTVLGSELASDKDLRETTWSGFDAEQLMSPFHAFFAGRTAGGTGVPDAIMFDNVVTDTGPHYNLNNGAYTVTVAGIYFISISVAQNPNAATQVQLFSSYDGAVFGVESTGTLSTGINFVNNAMLVFGLPGEQYTVYDQLGSYYSDEYLQTSWTILLISPSYYTEPIAWSIFTYDAYDYTDKTHDLSPFPYNVAKINTQDSNGKGIYDFSINTATITVAGYYYLYVNAQTALGLECQMNLVVNSGNNAKLEGGLSFSIRGQNGGMTMGRALIMNLHVDDQVYIELAQGTAMDNGPSLANSFSGFLLIQN